MMGKNTELASTEPLVSVLMPAFNAALHIEEAISSILNQTYKHFELLILNDGSTDQTQIIIDSFADHRIKTLKHLQNFGLTKARNQLVMASQGKYIALMDADDIAHPERLKIQVACLEKGNIDVCGTDYYSLYEKTMKRKHSKQPHNDADIRALMTVYSPLCNPTVAGRTELFRSHPYQNQFSVAEDYALWQQLSLAGARFTNIKTPLLTYRIHQTQISQKLQSKTQEMSASLQTSYCKALGIEVSLKPDSCTLEKRLKKAPRFLFLLNRQIPGITLFANWQIYARYQLRNNGLFTPFMRIERFIFALFGYAIGRVFSLNRSIKIAAK